jgi:hypothetical protein
MGENPDRTKSILQLGVGVELTTPPREMICLKAPPPPKKKGHGPRIAVEPIMMVMKTIPDVIVLSQSI